MKGKLPGVALCVGLTVLAWLAQGVEERLVGHAVIEAIVLALLFGVALRTAWAPSARWRAGIHFTAKPLLEIAIVLLGATVSLPVLFQAGPALVIAIALVVALGIGASVTIGRGLKLNRRLAILVACGNSICGNSAIAAVAPVIGAESDDVAAAIAFTAVLGVVLVLVLPALAPLLGLSRYQYGVLAGMTVYAVPQVLAATVPVSALSAQVGTLVKLTRVLMLGPVVFTLALRFRSATPEAERPRGARALMRYVPWFLIGFLLLAALRSVGALAGPVVSATQGASRWLTVAAMAALGLGVDVRAVRRVGRPVMLAVTGSVCALILLATGVIWALGIH